MALTAHNVSIQYTRNGAQRGTWNHVHQAVPNRHPGTAFQPSSSELGSNGWPGPESTHAPQVHRDESLLGVDVVIDSEKGKFEATVDSEFVEDMGQVMLDGLFTE